MQGLFIEGLFRLDHVTVGIDVAVMLEVGFQQVAGILIREQRVDLDCQLLTVQVLIRDVIRHIRRSAGTHAETHTHSKYKSEYGNHFLHLILAERPMDEALSEPPLQYYLESSRPLAVQMPDAVSPSCIPQCSDTASP